MGTLDSSPSSLRLTGAALILLQNSVRRNRAKQTAYVGLYEQV